MLLAISAASAHAAFPGRNGPLAYYFPDPIADLGYVEFVPIFGPVPSVFERWEEIDSPGTVSPGGRRLTILDRWRGRWAIWVMRKTPWGGRATLLAPPPRGREDGEEQWAPSGTSVVFVRQTTEGRHRTIFTKRLDPRSRARRLGRGWSPVWSSRGRIAYVAGGPGRETNIWTMRWDGSDRRQITSGGRDDGPEWSPDGASIAFARVNGVRDPDNGIYAPPTDIHVVSAAGGAPRRLTDTPDHEQWPAYSPDGRWIAYGGYKGTITIVSSTDPARVLRTIRCGYPIPTPEDRYCGGLDWLPAVR